MHVRGDDTTLCRTSSGALHFRSDTVSRVQRRCRTVVLSTLAHFALQDQRSREASAIVMYDQTKLS